MASTARQRSLKPSLPVDAELSFLPLRKTKVGMQTKPKKGKGERWLDCPQYENCLDFCATLNYKSFNCESCGFYIETLQKPPAATVKQENTRICSECGKNPTIQPNSPLCASCIGKQAWKDGKAKKKRPPNKKAPGSLKRKRTTQGKGKHKAEIGQPRPHFEVIFSEKYGQVLKEVEKLAEEEIRSVDQQIIFILFTSLKPTFQKLSIQRLLNRLLKHNKQLFKGA